METSSASARLATLSFEIMHARASLESIIGAYPMPEPVRARLAEVAARLAAADAADAAALRAIIAASAA